MKGQPNQGYESNDRVQTPPELCRRIINHFHPLGTVLEPCRGDGNFYAAMEEYQKVRQTNKDWLGHVELDWCEIEEGKDFYDYKGRANWIITNPPWSLLKSPRGKDTHPMSFLEKCFQSAESVALVMTLNHAVGLKSRYSMADKYGFGIKQIILLDTPPEPWPQSGFQVACVEWSRRTKWIHYLVSDWRTIKGDL